MGKLLRCITTDGAVMVAIADTTDIVERAKEIHNSTPVVTAALGRLLTAGSIMGNALKNKDDSVTVKIHADGPAGNFVVAADYFGNVRGYCDNPKVELPLNSKGKLDVSGAVGKNGTLYVLKDVGLKEPYNGAIPLVSGEIAEDITAYYAVSEQIPSVCALGVLVNIDNTVASAGGFLIQLLPGADDKTIDLLEQGVNDLPPISNLLAENTPLLEIVKRALKNFEVEVMYETEIEYKCNCSKARVERALISLGRAELEEMAAEKEQFEVNCQFCDRIYSIKSQELRKMAKNL